MPFPLLIQRAMKDPPKPPNKFVPLPKVRPKKGKKLKKVSLLKNHF